MLVYGRNVAKEVLQKPEKVKKIILKHAETGVDIVIVQLSGSLLDYENLVYLNALREIIMSEGKENVFVLTVDFLQYVDVLITYSQTSTVVPMYSETESSTITEETDSGGGTRKQESSNINKEVITDGENKAITQTVMFPKIEGAIVIAEGGENVTIKTNIIQAVSAVTGLATYKVQVFEMKK